MLRTSCSRSPCRATTLTIALRGLSQGISVSSRSPIKTTISDSLRSSRVEIWRLKIIRIDDSMIIAKLKFLFFVWLKFVRFIFIIRISLLNTSSSAISPIHSGFSSLILLLFSLLISRIDVWIILRLRKLILQLLRDTNLVPSSLLSSRSSDSLLRLLG